MTIDTTFVIQSYAYGQWYDILVPYKTQAEAEHLMQLVKGGAKYRPVRIVKRTMVNQVVTETE